MVAIFHLFYLFAFALKFTAAGPAKPIVFNENEKPLTAIIREENELIVPWISGRKLTWDDFLSAPQLNTDAVALTSTTLGLTYKITDSNLEYQITCNFTKHKSWGSMKTNYILAHEQGHFDITELFARKLYQSMQEYQINPGTFKKDISERYQQIVKEKEMFQHAYDKETDHSRNRKMQQVWEEKIEELLQATMAYAEYP